jgi:hypothetical protein
MAYFSGQHDSQPLRRFMTRIALTFLSTLSFTTIFGADPFVGAWNLNLDKSRLPVNSDLASLTMTISTSGPNTYTTIVDSITKSGEKRHQEMIRIYDGKEHPAKGVGFKPGLSEICERLDASVGKIQAKETERF